MSSQLDHVPGGFKIAVDAMGGDHAPRAIVAGSVQAARMYPDQVEPVLVGNAEEIHGHLTQLGAADLSLRVEHAEQRVEMAEGGADAFRRKRHSSLNVATRLVRDGEAVGVFSAGNTGAMVAASLINLGRIPGVNRPAIATLVPTQSDKWAVMLDVGATADCKPLNLVQFAILGDVYARLVLGIERPRIGLLNIGEEPTKGNALTQETHALMNQTDLYFVGNVEGRDILKGRADVVVTDGFTGNVLLKFAESVWTWGAGAVRREIGEHLLAKMGAFLLKPSLRRFKATVDYTDHGGAPLLGVNGVAVIGHGRSTPKAIRNALRISAEIAGRGIIDAIRSEFQKINGGKVANS